MAASSPFWVLFGIIIGTLAFLGIGLSKMNSIVSFIVSFIFFFADINLVKTTSDRT